MSSVFGRYLRLSVFGQSHGPAVGVTVDGLPAGMPVDLDAVRAGLARRAPGQGDWTTVRREADEPEILSGILNGRATGQPVCAVIRSTGQHSEDYGELDLPRPGHADYTGHVRFGGWEDWRGGGSFSGRLTAPLVFAGELCRQFLAGEGVSIHCHISRLADLFDDPIAGAAPEAIAALAAMPLPVLRAGLAEAMRVRILEAKADGDSVGGELTCRVDGVPAGLGAPFFDSAESVLAQLLFSVPGVKAVGFGDGAGFAGLRGSEANDPFRVRDGRVVTETNRSGGINGGVTNGMPVLFTATVRPTPSIAKAQRTVSLGRMEDAEISVRGRHDPCILPRAVPVVEAVAAIGLTELWKERLACGPGVR